MNSDSDYNFVVMLLQSTDLLDHFTRFPFKFFFPNSNPEIMTLVIIMSKVILINPLIRL